MFENDFGKIFEGSYTYYHKDTPYSEESFHVMQNRRKDVTRYISEVVTRLNTGELLKINVYYEVDAKWLPLKVIIEKSIGTEKVTETFQSNFRESLLNYKFERGRKKKFVKESVNGVYHIATPTFATSVICMEHRNLNVLGRTRYIYITSPNDWEFQGPFQEKSVFLEPKSTDIKEKMIINGQELTVKTCYMFEHDKMENIQEEPIIFHMSKHIGIPYMVIPDKNIKIQINKLIHHDNPMFD